jgi:DNA-binding NarL/FixJ family response regulator
MLAARLDERELLDSLRAGANGYLLKDTDPARLPHILTGALSGEAVLPRKLTSRVIEEFRGRPGGRRLVLDGPEAVVLTPREWQVLEALRDRTATTEIAARFSLSPVTVRRHISHIVGKLRVPDREAAIRLFESHG